MSVLKQVDFTIKPRNKTDQYFGFSLEEDPLHIMPDGTIFHNSGKSVTEQSIVGHVSRYSDRFQLVGVDCKRVEFNLLRGVKGVKGVALDVPTAAAAVAEFQKQMMNRFKFMEQMQVNNVYKIKDKEVDYYEWAGQKYQFDEMFELMVDLDESDRNYNKMKQIYPEGRQPMIITIQQIYNGMQEGTWEGRNPQMPVVKGINSYLDKNSIRKTKGIFTPKILLFLADELNELMTSEDYKSVDTVKSALGSIARLGRAAAVHLALACQRASNSTISTDLKNNIQMSVLLGGFDDGASQLMFEKDISQLAKPHIKGRGFLGSGQEIIETQTYYTQPENDWEFDEDQLLTYNNPVFVDQCKKRNKDFDALNTGWVPQKRIGEEEEELEEVEELEEDEDDDIDEPDPEVLFNREKSKRDREDRKSSEDRPRRSRPEIPERSNKEDTSKEDTEKADKKEDKAKEAPTPKKPEVSEDDILGGFGFGDDFSETDEAPSISSSDSSNEISTRDKVHSAISNQTSDSKPKIKLNIDKTTIVDNQKKQPMKIKLNLKK